MNSPQSYIRPVIPILFSLMAGIMAGQCFPGHSAIPLAVAIFCFTMIILALWRRTTASWVPLVLFIALGYLLVQKPAYMEKMLSSFNHIRAYAGKGDVKVAGLVSTVPDVQKRDLTFILDHVRVVDDEGRQLLVKGKLKARSALINGMFAKGDTIEMAGKIKEFHNYNNPGGFDYKRFMEKDDIWGTINGKKGGVFLMEKGRPTPLDRMRSTVEDLIEKTSASRPGMEVLKALITGTRTGIPRDLQDDFSRTGTIHLLSISGLHVAIVAGFSFMVLRFFFSFITPLLWHGKVNALAGALSLGPVWVYGFMAGMPPGTLRAVIMATVLLLTYGFQAEHEIVNTLAVAAMVILALEPRALFDISFQLSFVSVLSIVLGLSALKMERREDRGRDDQERGLEGLKKNVAAFVLVSVFAFAGTWPLVAYYFNQISLIGFVANAVLIPLVGTLVVALGLSAVFVLPFGLYPALWLFEAAGFILDFSIGLIRFFSSLPWASFKIVTPSILEMASYYTVLTALLGIGFIKKTNLKHLRAYVFMAAIAILVLVCDGVYWVNKRYYHKDLRITCLDVGQGASSLVELPGGECMLIDGGGFSDNEIFDVGERIVAPFLWSKKIAHVNKMVLTHPESDHMNGLLYVLEHFRVDELWTNGIQADTRGFRRLIDLANLNHVRIRPRKDLADTHDMNGVSFRIFWPLKDHDSEMMYSGKKGNAMSLVMKLTFGDQTFLFPGDILQSTEEEMIGVLMDPGELKSRVIAVPHHGSKSSSGDLFLKAVSPEYAVISVGYKNWFRFPHPVVLERLASQKSTVYRTDRDGAVLMTTFGKDLHIETMVTVMEPET
jgi:competence protein ComEC